MDPVLAGVAAIIASTGAAVWLVFCGVAFLKGTKRFD